MNAAIRKLRTAAFAGGLAALIVAAAGCDPGAEIIWVNETDETANVYLGESEDDFDVSIQPHRTLRVDTIKAVWEDVVVVRDDAGNIVLRLEITWDQLKEQGFRFVIKDTAE